MRKFIYGCLLLSFLFTLLYVTPCYAFSESDVKNLIYNYYVNGTTYSDYDNFKNYLDSVDFSNILSSSSNSQYFDLTEFFNNSDYSLFARRSEPGQNGPLVIYFVSNNAEKPIFYSNNRYYVSNMGFLLFRVNTIPALRCYKRNTVSNSENVGSAYDNVLFFDEKDCYNPAYTLIYLSAPYNSPSWFNTIGPFLNHEFSFYVNELATTQYVDLLTDNGIGGIYTFENVPVLYSANNFGYLVDTLENHVLESDALGFYYLSGSGDMWTYKSIYERTLGVNELYSNDYITVNYDSYDYPHISLKNSILFKNVLYVYNIYDSNQQQVNGIFYLGDSSTVISGGLIDTSNFGDSYFNQFNGLDNLINNNDNTQVIIDNQNNNTQAIINNINNGDNVSGELSSFFSGDYNDIGEQFNFKVYDNDYRNFLYGFFLNAGTVIKSTGNPYLEIRYRDYYKRLYASEIYLPNGTLKTFISAFLVLLYALYLCTMIYQWVSEVETGDLMVMHDTDADVYFYM